MSSFRRFRLLALLALAATTVAGTVSGVSVGSAAATVGQIRVSPNRPLAADPFFFRGKDAVGLAVNPEDPDHIVEVNTDLLNYECEFHVSRDGGQTWGPDVFDGTEDDFQAPAGFADNACSAIGHGMSAMDQSVAFGSGDDVYTAFASPRVVSGVAEGSWPQAVIFAKSTDGGDTWGTSIAIDTPVASVEPVPNGDGTFTPGAPMHNFPKLVVDRDATPDKIYLVAQRNTKLRTGPTVSSNQVVLSVSDDAGATWSTPQAVTPDPASESQIEPSQPVLLEDPDAGGPLEDTLYVAFRQAGAGAPTPTVSADDETPKYIVVAGTQDDGATWSRENAARVVGWIFAGSTGHSPGGTSAFPRLAGDVVDGQHNLYLVYNQGPIYDANVPGPTIVPCSETASGECTYPQLADHFMHQDFHVLFTRSIAGGAWESAERISDPPLAGEVPQTRHPNISVAPDGRIDVVWQDRRHWYQNNYDWCTNTHHPPAGTSPCDEVRLGDTYYTYSEDAGADWAPNRRITDRSMNNDVGYDYRFATYWDFGPVAVPVGQDRILVGWMDARLGNWDTDAQDIFLADVDLDASGAPPSTTRTGDGTAQLARRISQLGYPAGFEGVLEATFTSKPFTKVVIVNRRDPAAALAATVLARANAGSVLLANAGGLPADAVAEIRRLQVADVSDYQDNNPNPEAPSRDIAAFLVGTTTDLGSGVVQDLLDLGVSTDHIRRLDARSLATKAKFIAEAMDYRTRAQRRAGVPAFDGAVVVNPSTPHGFAAATLAAAKRLPVLFVGRTSIPTATDRALLRLAIENTLVIGGTDVVSNGVLEALPGARRIGSNRLYPTSRAIVEESRARGLPLNVAFVSDGGRPMDSALLGAAAARIGGVHILTSGASISSARSALAGLGINSLDRIIRVTSAG